MFKQSPSRNLRSKGFRVKHVLQICLLVAVCFWLVYQVKRSHDKREELDAKDEKAVGKVQADAEIPRFGRKDLPRVTETATDVEEHSLDEDEKEEEEENKHEDDEPEIEDNGIQDTEDEDVYRGGGDDEIDENDLEKAEAEIETEHEGEFNKSEAQLNKTEHTHEEEHVDEDKEREENEGGSVDNHTENEEFDDVGNEDHSETEKHEDAVKEHHSEDDEDGSKADHNEGDVKVEEKDHDGDNTNTHEAREEQYKADDASSEVSQDIQTVMRETRNATTGHENEIWSKVSFGQENENVTSNNDDVGSQPREDQVNNNGTSTNVTVTELKPEMNLTKSDDSFLQNSTLSENSTVGVAGYENLTLAGNISEHVNKSEVAMDDENQSQAAAGSNVTENVNANVGESLIANDTSASFHNTNDTNTMSVKSEKLENSGKTGSGESLIDHSSDEGANVIQHDPIDTSDTTLTQEEKESRMDLDTLPEITTEVQNTDDSMAE